MDIRCENEGKRLFLYHLAQVFLHEKAESLRMEAKQDGNRFCVTLTGTTTFSGEAEMDLKTHLQPHRAEQVALGLAFARAALPLSGYTPPYGTLIGVRPVKVPLFYLEQGQPKEAVISLLKRDFLVSEEKAKLLVTLAEREAAFQNSLSENEGMLYVSIPFCPSRCSYCSFVSSAAPRHLSLIPDYLSLLENEVEQTATLLREANRSISAVYIGGGTPGILTAAQMNSLLQRIRNQFPHPLKEFCVEMGRPDTVTKEKLQVLSSFGVDRISINPQTTCNDTLLRIGRKHSAEDFFCAMELAKQFPFAINCDLISALPGETPEIFLRSVEETLALEPENLTIHALCLKKSADDRTEAMPQPEFHQAVEIAYNRCINHGLQPYYLYRQKKSALDLENFGFAKEGHLGIYNLAMMEDLCDIFACGAGGIGKLIPRSPEGKITRFAGFKYPFEYLSQSDKIAEKLDRIRAEWNRR